MKYKILSAIISIVLMISLVGCQQNNTIIKPDIETKTVTENSEGDYITFSLDIPLNWKLYAQNCSPLLLVLVLMQTKQMPAKKFLPTS